MSQIPINSINICAQSIKHPRHTYPAARLRHVIILLIAISRQLRDLLSPCIETIKVSTDPVVLRPELVLLLFGTGAVVRAAVVVSSVSV